MGFNLDDYEPVKDRIKRFYADHPDGRILTDLITDPAALDKLAGFRASAYIGDILKATGFAFESQGTGVNRDAWVENAETSAIGRALANMDYCGTLRPSREEMEKVSRKESEIVALKNALIDYINAGVFEHPENVQKVMDANNVELMRAALVKAKAREKEIANG